MHRRIEVPWYDARVETYKDDPCSWCETEAMGNDFLPWQEEIIILGQLIRFSLENEIVYQTQQTHGIECPIAVVMRWIPMQYLRVCDSQAQCLLVVSLWHGMDSRYLLVKMTGCNMRQPHLAYLSIWDEYSKHVRGPNESLKKRGWHHFVPIKKRIVYGGHFKLTNGAQTMAWTTRYIMMKRWEHIGVASQWIWNPNCNKIWNLKWNRKSNRKVHLSVCSQSFEYKDWQCIQ